MPSLVTAESLTHILGVVYVHRRTSDGGDIYLTRHGLRHARLLEVSNWYEQEWFSKHRERLLGTSCVFRVPTKEVDGESLELVVKNSRVGEHVPIETKTILDFLRTEFNSPWEEFALVMEMREGAYGPPDLKLRTQYPLAIYVPPVRMQTWQTGRSLHKIHRIQAKHPGINLDILRQYKLIYGWIRGRNVVKLLEESGWRGKELDRRLAPLTQKAMEDLSAKGYAVIDFKPDHIIIEEEHVRVLESMRTETDQYARRRQVRYIGDRVRKGEYSIVDYELLIRTPEHEEEVSDSRRHHYLDDQRDREHATEMPEHLRTTEVLGVPYVFGRAESTGGKLWVVGRNADLFDYFLPERWRRAHSWKLSRRSDVFYTFTKDSVHIVWKTSKVGELPLTPLGDSRREALRERGYNSPFEEFAIAQDLSRSGVPTVYARAIYMTGSEKVEPLQDRRRYDSHREILDPEGEPILREDRNYISIRGYYNGPDSWVAKQDGRLLRPISLQKARQDGIISDRDHDALYGTTVARLRNVGYDGSFLEGSDLLICLDPKDHRVRTDGGEIEVRVANFELIRKL